VHRWLQIVGKIRLVSSPWTNHSWHVPFYVTAQGLTTSLVFQGSLGFQIDFDFIDHSLQISTTGGDRRSFGLQPMPVASFYARTLHLLRELGIEISIWPVPVEIPDPIEAFPDDVSHAAYDREAIARLWQAFVQVKRVCDDFRARFIGKVSPVHLFWGAFDLAVTRFSGRTAPRHPGGAPHCADWVMQEAYSHEVSSAGFWPGAGLGEPAFYSYAYPEPAGFAERRVEPEAAYYHTGLREFILPYAAVAASASPDAALLSFLQSTYDAAADLASWDRPSLERGSSVLPRGRGM
jgi:hypothetical protein